MKEFKGSSTIHNKLQIGLLVEQEFPKIIIKLMDRERAENLDKVI